MNGLKLLHRLVGLLLVALIVAGCGGAPATPSPMASAATPLPNSSTLPAREPTAAETAPAPVTVFREDVGGYRLFMECAGDGSPAVILDAGFGEDHFTWFHVQYEIGRLTRVCSYDRAGLGQSEAAPTPRTSQHIVQDLHTLLGNAAIRGPYVLVGHSFGGLNVRLYADQYPDEVAGMVLVDARHEDSWARSRAVLPPATPDDSQGLKDLRTFLEDPPAPDQDPGNVERIDLEASDAHVRATGALGDLPLVVLTAGRGDPPPDLPEDVAVRLGQVEHELQQELAQLSTNSTHIIVDNSGHYIHDEQLDVVVAAIQRVVDAARHGTRVDAVAD
jgi:pimeloyl-ACP methyl ester carboxylesterase